MFVTRKQLENAKSGNTGVSSREVQSKQRKDNFPNTVNADYTATVELTSDWTESNGVWTAKARRVSWSEGKYDKLTGKEFTIHYPLQSAGDGKPDLSTGNRCNVVHRGRWEVIGGGGGGGQSIPCRFGMTLEAFNAGTVGNVRLYNNFAMTSYTTVKAFVPPNFYQVAVAANTPCELLPSEYIVGSETIKWMIGPILYSSPEPTP